MKTSKQKRLECVNWDRENLVALNRKGKNHTISRKVLTKDVEDLEAGELIAEAIRLLKCGYEVRILDDDGNPAIRLYPCVERDMKSMFVASQTMEDFRHSLRGKKIAFTHNGDDLSEEDAVDLAEKSKQRGDEVTPDKMVTCPKCGKHFRVGKKTE